MDTLNSSYSLISSHFVELRPIDLLRWEELPDGSFRYISDVELLLNEERLINVLGEDNYRHMVASMAIPSKTYTQGSFDDDLLMSSVKSRYIQTPSELSAWVDSLKFRGDEILSDIEASRKALIDAEVSRQAAAAAPLNAD